MAEGTVCADDQVEAERFRFPVVGHDQLPIADVYLCDLRASMLGMHYVMGCMMPFVKGVLVL